MIQYCKRGSEAHAIICPDTNTRGHGTFAEEWAGINRELRSFTARMASEGFHTVFRRYYFTDIANQALYAPADMSGALSLVQQPPLNGGKCAVLAIYRKGVAPLQLSEGIWGYANGEAWIGDIPQEARNSHSMTDRYLTKTEAFLREQGGTLADNCLRTWFFVRDIDENYAGMVKARNELFARSGLSADTHFIASTGIEGRGALPHSTVAYNALVDMSLQKGDIKYLYGSTHFNPTAEYGVAFERGAFIDRADGRYIYISGTASIDNRGQIVCPGDIVGQTERMIENIGVLLAEAGAGWNDAMHLVVYLRDLADAPIVERILSDALPDIPRLLTLAPVCRPGWLVESECMAIAPR